MCNRVAASIAYATGFGDQMVVSDTTEYEERAVSLAKGLQFIMFPLGDGLTTVRRESGELSDLRRNILLNRDHMPLFDTRRWTRNIEKAYVEAWRRWVDGVNREVGTVGEDGVVSQWWMRFHSSQPKKHHRCGLDRGTAHLGRLNLHRMVSTL
jgi:hypothetical protein